MVRPLADMVSDSMYKTSGNNMGQKRLKLYFFGGVDLTIISTVYTILN